MATVDGFLTKYKDLETVLRENNLDYKEVLEEETSPNAAKYTITRQMRNFLSHNSDQKFLTPSDAQIKLLDEAIKKYKMKDDLIKKHVKKLDGNTVKVGDTVKTAIILSGNRKYSKIPVYSVIRGKETVGYLDLFTALSTFEKSPSAKVADIMDSKKISIVYGDEKFDTLVEGLSFVKDRKTDKIIGIVTK